MGASSVLLLVAGTSCMDNFLPEEKDAFDRDVNFTTTLFTSIRVYLIVHSQHCL